MDYRWRIGELSFAVEGSNGVSARPFATIGIEGGRLGFWGENSFYLGLFGAVFCRHFLHLDAEERSMDFAITIFRSILGLGLLLLMCYGLSVNRNRIRWKLVGCS